MTAIAAFHRLGLNYGARPEMALSSCELEWLLELVCSAEANTSLEIGLGYGVSAAALLYSGVAKHTSVEKYEQDIPTALSNVEKVIRSDQRFELIKGSSDMVLPGLVRKKRCFDVVLIDGGHRFDDVFIDVYYATMLLPARGIMLVDDTWMNSIKTVMSWIDMNRSDVLVRRGPPKRLARRRDFHLAAFVKRSGANDRRQRTWSHYRAFATFADSD